MKPSITKLSLLALVTGALIFAPNQSSAQDKKEEKAPKPDKAEKAEKKGEGDANKAANPNRALPFRGKASAVDAKAKTLTVGTKVYQVTSDTRISKDDRPATFDDIKADEYVRGSARQSEDGKLNLVSVFIGPKPPNPDKEGADKSGAEKTDKRPLKGANKGDQKQDKTAE